MIIIFLLLSLAAQAQFKAGRHLGFDTLEVGIPKVITNCGAIHGKLFFSYYKEGIAGTKTTVVFDGNRVIAKWPFEVRVGHLKSGEYLIANLGLCYVSPISPASWFYCWSESNSGGNLFKVSEQFELTSLNWNLTNTGGLFYQVFELGGQLFSMYDPIPISPNRIEANIYRLIDTNWVRQCSSFVLNTPRQAIAINDTAYNLGPYILPPNGCPLFREYMFRGTDSTSRNIFGPFYAILEEDTIFHSVEFNDSTLGIGVTNFQPNYTRPPDFIPIHQRKLPSSLFNFWKSEQFVYFRSGFNARFSGLPEMQSSPLYVLENFKRGTRIFPIAVSEYDSSNFAGRLLDTTNGVSNRIVAIPASGFAGFVIHNDTLYLPGYSCTAPYFEKMCESSPGQRASHLYYIPVSTIMDSLGINRIVTQTKPKQQATNPNWRLYPNPAKEQLQVAGLERGERFVLLNSQGKQVGSLSYPGKELSINHLPKGMYVGVWQGHAGMKTEKVVVE